jgi:hypothetical protein
MDPRHHPQLIQRGRILLSGRLRNCDMLTILLLILQRIPQLVPPGTTTITTSALREYIKDADKGNKQAKEQTLSLREKFLTEQAQAQAAVGNQTEPSARISLLNGERMKSAHTHTSPPSSKPATAVSGTFQNRDSGVTSAYHITH